VQPRDGDVVVSRESRPTVKFGVRRVPGVVQFTSVVRDDAVQVGRGFARKHAVDLWYCDGPASRLLERYRRG
jgi:hypothetical protein